MCSRTTQRFPRTQTHPDFITLSLPLEADNWRSHLVSLWHREKKKRNKDRVTARMGHQSKFPLLLHFAATSSYLHPLPASAPLSAPVTISQQRRLGALTSSDVTQLSLSHPDSPPPPTLLVLGSFLKAPISMSGSRERLLDSLLSERYLNSSASKTCSVHNVTLYLSAISVAPFSLQDSILIECPPAMASAAVSMRLNAPPRRR